MLTIICLDTYAIKVLIMPVKDIKILATLNADYI